MSHTKNEDLKSNDSDRRAWTNTQTHRQTNKQTNGRYQTHYLPCFAVDKNQRISVPVVLENIELRHTKTHVNIFVVVAPKEGLVGGAPQILLFFTDSVFYSQCHTKRRIRVGPTGQSFFWYNRDKDIEQTVFCCT